MYKLFFSPGACSMAIHVALNECNQAVALEKVDLHSPQPRPPELLKYNPRGQVPVLLDGDHAIFEGAAILIYLLEKHNSSLLPKSGLERADALQWLMFCNATLHPAYGRVFGAMRAKVDDNAREILLEAAITHVNKLWEDVEKQLEHSSYLAGNQITIADIVLTVIANWSSNLPKPVKIGAKTKALLQQVSKRPTYQKALETEHVEYKAAA